MPSIKLTAAAVAAGVLFSAASAFAGPIYVFSTSVGVQPSDFATITLTQVNSTTVDVLVDIDDTTLPAPRYGFLNTGGPHTPFAFSLAGSGSLTASFLQPSGGAYTFGVFSLNSGGGSANPYGDFGVAIDSTASNGTANAYFGDLEFQLTRAAGLSTDDFITNALNAYFAGDFTDGSHTGSQAWKTRIAVPEPTSIGLLGVALAWLGVRARRRISL